MKNHSFASKAVLRTPLSEKKIDITWEEIQELFSITKNREALYIGSPNIYRALELYEKGEAFQLEDDLKNLRGSLYKYTSRLANRCTPFGLWASVSTLNLAKDTNIDIEHAKIKRTTKFDMYFLGEILPEITKHTEIRNVLKFYPNNSMYKVMDKYRFVEYYFKDSSRRHKISEVDINKYLEKSMIIAKDGATIKQLIKPIIDDSISEEDARNFINQVIDGQFFVSELEFTLTGEDYLERLLDILEEPRFNFYEGNVIKKLLKSLKGKISNIDEDVFNDPEKYRAIHALIEKKIQEADESKLFQVDSFKDLNQSTLSYSVIKQLRNAVIVLNKIQSKRKNPTLEEFKSKFQSRYEEYEQPLVNVLDPDIGIGYGSVSGAKTPLVDKLAIRGKSITTRQISWDKKKSFLFKKALEALNNDTKEIELFDEDINQFKEVESRYPDSFSTFFNVFHENGQEKLNLKSVWGPSANGLLGRFAHLDVSIETLCNEIHEHEKALYPDKILAEIIHLPQARTGNILYRKFQRDYEIPYLGNSSLREENQIDVQDLYVSVKRGRVILRSKRLNKEIIPRLGNAHNYSVNALPMYHFLCDIQDQEQSGLTFTWGGLEQEFKFLPRVSYKNVVLSRAIWNLNSEKIKSILNKKEENIIEVVRSFQKEENIPNLISFSKGDNELLINFENDLSCSTFYYMLKREPFIQLKEFLFKEDTVTGGFCNEFILPAYRNASKSSENNTVQSIVNEESSLQKASFSTGDEWLYYKFYCGERVGEKLLNHAIKPIVENLKANNLIDRWFFIRYHDRDGNHLRFRIHLSQCKEFSQCVSIINKFIKPFEDNLLVWKTQTDTYLRELQRYGYESIDATEELYHYDSEATVKFADLIEGDAGERVRWLFSLLSMDHLLDDFGFDMKQKMNLLSAAKTSFGEEFNRKGLLNKQVNTLYSENISVIEAFLSEEKKAEMYIPLWDILKERSLKNEPVVDQLKSLANQNVLPGGLANTVLSYLHMVCNRIFLTKQRIHEMVVYDMLYKYYSKKVHTQKKAIKKLTDNSI